MANIISDSMGMATPAIIKQIAASLGLSGDAVNSVLGAAVPSVLGALANKGSTPGGAKDILANLANVNPNLASAMMGGNTGLLATQGTSMLSSLIGQGGLSTLTNAVARSAGIPAAAGASIMGLASQMVMGSLAKSASGLDASGLSNLLASQKGAIQAALPAGLGSVLGMAGGASATMSSMGAAAASSATAAMRNPASNAQASMPDAPAMGGMDWLKYAIPVAIVVLGAWYFLGHRGTDDATMAKPAATATAPVAANMMVGDVDVSKNLTGALGDLTASLGTITDVASAQAALPKLQGAGTTITTITGLAAKFSPEQKATVAGLVNNGLPSITAAATKAESIAGVGDLLKPVLDGIINNLGAMK